MVGPFGELQQRGPVQFDLFKKGGLVDRRIEVCTVIGQTVGKGFAIRIVRGKPAGQINQALPDRPIRYGNDNAVGVSVEGGKRKPREVGAQVRFAAHRLRVSYSVQIGLCRRRKPGELGRLVFSDEQVFVPGEDAVGVGGLAVFGDDVGGASRI